MNMKNVSMFHHGNLCSVEHDDVAPVADTAEKQLHAMVPWPHAVNGLDTQYYLREDLKV